MEKAEQIKYKYTCKYCRKVYTEAVKECPGCGASDFIETSYLVTDTKKKIRMIAIPVVIICIILFLILGIVRPMTSTDDSFLSEFVTKEYSYDPSLLDDPEMCIGKTAGDTKINDYVYIQVTGSYKDLTDNIYNNIFTSQMQRYTFSVPCDIEIKDGDFHAEITGLDFSYFKSNSYVDTSGHFAGTTDKDISIYLVDTNGNKDKLLIADYIRVNEYSSIAQYLCSDELIKSFSINNNLMEYKSIIVEYGDSSQEFTLDYDRAYGTLEYSPLQNK